MNKKELEAIILEEMQTDKMGKRDLCSLYGNREFIKALVSYLAEPFRGKVDYVASPESLGFILGGMMASELGVGFIPIRDSRRYQLYDDVCERASYVDHQNMVRTLQCRKANIPEKKKILLVDDWVGTAATIQACKGIVEEAACSLIGIASIGANYNEYTMRWIDGGELHCAIVK